MTAPHVIKCGLPGLYRIELVSFGDRRGFFQESWQIEKLAEKGLPEILPRQWNTSESYYGVIRGIHAEPWDKYIHVVHGTAFGAIVDLRENEATFGQVETFGLDNNNALFVPAGLGNSFQATSPLTVYCYLVTSLWHGETNPYPAVFYADGDLGIRWPVERPTVSGKDANNPLLRNAYPEGCKRWL